MDIENLKLIISAVNELGVDSKEVFMWWLILTYGSTYLFGLIWSVISIFILKYFYSVLNGNSQLEQLRKAAGVSERFSQRELEKACRVLKDYYL